MARSTRLRWLLLAAALPACAGRAPAPAVTPLASVEAGWTEEGIASWYGDPFHGRRTASGELYDMDGLTAAHPSLPFGTVIRVENRDNGRAVELRVTDRGPFVDDRILDVSRAGARALGMIGPGTARIRITVLRPGGDAVAVRGGCVVVQVAAYRDRGAAETRAGALRHAGYDVDVEEAAPWFRVTVGPFAAVADAEAARDALDGFVRACP